MSKVVFTDKQVIEISKNSNVLKVTNKSIQFKAKFKIRIVNTKSYQ